MKKLIFGLLFAFAVCACDKTPDDMDREEDDTTQTTPPDDDEQNSDDERPGYETERPQFVITGDGAFFIPFGGGEFEVAVTTNLEYTIAVPEDAMSWVRVKETRALRTETIFFEVAANNGSEKRSTTVAFIDENGRTLQTIVIKQEAETEEEGPDETEKPQFGVTGKVMFTMPAEGGEFEVAVETNLEYTVAIPEDAQPWIVFKETRVLRTETLVFAVAENNGSEERSTAIAFIGEDGKTLQTIAIRQEAETKENEPGEGGIPLNEIHYTTIDGNTVELGNEYYPYQDGVTFGDGVHLVSNTYKNGVGILKFDNTITKIGENAFTYCEAITNITIPHSVTEIGNWAFFCCSALEDINIPAGVTEIAWQAFTNCFSLTSITLPDSIIEIKGHAFAHCTSLISITIPDSVIRIGTQAFTYCVNLSEFRGKFASADGRCLIVDGVLNSFAPAGLTEYTIPYGIVTKIGECAFWGSSALTNITIPDSVTEIGYEAFTYCENLSEFRGKFASDNGKCLIVDGVLNAFAPAGLTEYSIPYGVTKIGDSAFSWCTSLTNITIPSSVTEIGDSAFSRCTSLTNIIIPNSVTVIGFQAFWTCSALTSITIPEGVTEIKGYTFQYCESLTSVTIPKSVTEIGFEAFSGCYALESVYCKALTPPTLARYDIFAKNAYNRKIYVPYRYAESYRIAAGWKNYAYAIVGYDFENGIEVDDNNFEWEPVYSLKDPSRLLEYNGDTMSEDEFLHDSDGNRINGGLFTYTFWWNAEDDEVALLHQKNTTIFRMDNWGAGVSIIFTILPDETVNVDGKAYHRLVTDKQYIGVEYNDYYGSIYISNPELVTWMYNDLAIETYPNYWDGQYTFHFNWSYHFLDHKVYFDFPYEETFVMAGYNSSR